MENVLRRLCAAPGVPGCEGAAAETVAGLLEQYCVNVRTDALGSVLGERPGEGSRLLLDAHLDQIGMAVTGVEDGGFLRAAACGGMDLRVLAGQEVLVHGKQAVAGVIPAAPPHLAKGESKPLRWEDVSIDTGLTRQQAEQLVPLGSRVTLQAPALRLLGERFTAPALDNRAGVAVILRCLELLEGESLCPLTVLFSVQEEVGCAGAKPAGFASEAEAALVVDVSFAGAPGLDAQQAPGVLGGGVMIGISPALDEGMSKALCRLAQQQDIPHTLEVMGGRTGTNADTLQTAASGIACALLSIPLRNMHSAAEVLDLRDLEAAAQLMAAYIRERSAAQ